MNYEIYQLDTTPDLHELRFASYSETVEIAGEVKRQNYKHIYSGVTAPNEDIDAVLEHLYMVFNIKRPEDFCGHSLSVSDVIVLDGIAYFVDSFGFERLGAW